MAYLGLARKYRPQKFSDLIGQEVVVKILQTSLNTGKISHAYVFSGPKGVGKTSTARILAKALNCTATDNKPCDSCPSCIAVKEGKAMSVIEMDAASHTSVENIRDLRENVRYASVEGQYKVYIIDEAHMLSQAAFNAFLKTLEEPPPHVVFVLATTEPRKIPLTVLSRCQHLQFRRIPIQLIKQRLEFICKEENINATEEALYAIASNAEGSMRDALMLLDQITSFTENITLQDVNLLIGGTDVKVLYELTTNLINGNRQNLITYIDELNDRGTDFKVVTKDLIYFLRNLLVSKITKNYRLNITEAEASLLEQLGKETSEEHLLLLLKELINSEYAIKNSFFPRVTFEITLLKLSFLSHFRNIDEVIKEVEAGIQPRETSVLQACTENYEDAWSQIIKKLEQQNHILATKIKYGRTKIEGKEIQLIYNGGTAVYADAVREALPEIQKMLKELGCDVKITIHEKENEKKEKSGHDALNHPLVKKTLQLFEGRISNITPKKGGNNV